MNNVIIGTAGHVDHGKTSLIKALTGIDTDRLKEEQKRGITIELGFAHLDFENGKKVGIVDVPGHEKFVKNMLAGAGGIDIALIVVAANEGIMPQTIEHFEILNLLGIKKGLIVITKTDMVEGEWLEIIEDDIKKLVENTVFENAEIMRCSVYKNQGIGEIRQALLHMVLEASNKDSDKAFRIPIDRVFSIDGFGTVITGTLIEGSLSKGDNVCIYPEGLKTKVRNIQVHDTDVETAFAGQRAAVNLAGIKRENIGRGSVVAKPESMNNTFMVDVSLQALKDSDRVIKNNSRVHLYHGSRDILCKVILLDKDELMPGESAYAQLRLEEEVSFKYGDRYIIRFYSPLETIGGGMVINPNPAKHQRNKEEIINNLNVLEYGDLRERIAAFVKEKSASFPTLSQINVLANCSKQDFDEALLQLSENKSILIFDQFVMNYFHYEQIKNKSSRILSDFHKKNPLKNGMNPEEFRSKLFMGFPDEIIKNLTDILEKDKAIKIQNGLIAKFDFKVKIDDSYMKTADEIEKIYFEAGVIVPNKDDVLAKIKDKNKVKVFESLVNNQRLIMLDKQLFFHKDVFDDCFNKMKEFIQANGEITLGQFRDLIGASRKYAMAMLDYCDSKKITKKTGDSRVLFK